MTHLSSCRHGHAVTLARLFVVLAVFQASVLAASGGGDPTGIRTAAQAAADDWMPFLMNTGFKICGVFGALSLLWGLASDSEHGRGKKIAGGVIFLVVAIALKSAITTAFGA